MTIRGCQKPPHIPAFDYRGAFETGMSGWKGSLTVEQAAQIAAQPSYYGENQRDAHDWARPIRCGEI
jgi:hypothetical protein